MCTYLADLVGLVRGKLTKIVRMMLSALIVIEVRFDTYMHTYIQY